MRRICAMVILIKCNFPSMSMSYYNTAELDMIL